MTTASNETQVRVQALAALDRIMWDIGESLTDAVNTIPALRLDDEVKARFGNLIDSHAAVRSAITKSEWKIRSDPQ